jgi:hypothetical protein
MSERSKGALTAQMFGARLGTNADIRMRYTPAHINASGKKVNSRLSAPFILNLRGKEGGVRYNIIVWGKLGDMFARNWNEGKEMHFPQLEHNPYQDVVFSRVDRSIIMDLDGQPVKSWTDSWILRDFRWGNESQKTLQREMHAEGCSDGSGKRPLNWNLATNADNAAWKAILEMRKNTYFSPQHLQAGVFGFADVVMPRGGGQILFGAQYEREAVIYQGVPAVAVVPNYNPQRTRVIQTVATGQPGATVYAPAPGTVAAPGAPGAAMVANPHVPIQAQVATALTPTNCVKCQAPLAAGMAFCAGCGNPVVATAPGMPAGQPVYQPPVAAIPVVAGAPVPFSG